MKYIVLILLFIVTLSINTKSQTAELNLISSSGGVISNNDIQMAFTVGELITETFTTQNLMLTQGFLQYYLNPTSVTQTISNAITITAYPNPTIKNVNIEINQSIDKILNANFSLAVININGKIMQQLQLQEYLTTIDLSSYYSGTYFFKISNNIANYQETIIIQKINH